MDDDSDMSDAAGSVPAMSATAPIEPLGMTAEQLLELPDDGMRHELVEGELKPMTPAGSEHGRVAAQVGARIRGYVEEQPIWVRPTLPRRVSSCGRAPDTVLAPDVAFVAHARLSARRLSGFAEMAPDLVVEVVSPWDRASEVSAKAADVARCRRPPRLGRRPAGPAATVHHPGGQDTVLREDGMLDGEDVLPGFRLPLASILR